MEIDLTWTQKHPISRVQWVLIQLIRANDYNPNSSAKTELNLLKLSIEVDGFTQPIVVWKIKEFYEVVDGFHRYLVGLDLGMTHLPVVILNDENTSLDERIAATVRHNRARGKHQVGLMSKLIVELSRLGKTDQWISEHLGMEDDEVLRLKQVSGLTELFKNREFSEAWTIEE